MAVQLVQYRSTAKPCALEICDVEVIATRWLTQLGLKTHDNFSVYHD